jgi:hypothetical protein
MSSRLSKWVVTGSWIILCASVAAVRGASVVSAAAARSWSSQPPCQKGTIRCVDGVVTEMTDRFDDLANKCDHDALFALVYLRTTEEYRRTVAADRTFFSDTAYVNREDAVFSEDYFTAYDGWHAGAATAPEAWAIAFEAAERHEVSGLGNILLGMNAHINRDLPFVLASMGLTDANGASRKADHNKVNVILGRVARGPVFEEAAKRFDPSIRNSDVPGTTIDSDVFLQLVVSWRELAWQNAVRLVTAANDFERGLVADEIEASAAAQALTLKVSSAYLPPLTSSQPRDTYCAAR